MSIKIKVVKDDFPRIQKTLKLIKGKKVQVGVFNGEHAWLASIHEFGCVITPSRSKYLTVPVNPKAFGKKASAFNDLFVVRTKSGEMFLCKSSGKDVEFYYWLTKSVRIPERSFLRSGFDNSAEDVIKNCDKALNAVLAGDMSEGDYFNMVGRQLSRKIQTFARDLKSPANNWATKAAKGTSNPLIQTGQMIRSIGWEIE